MYNGHGDVTGFVDYFGKAGANYTYDAFGNQTSSTEEVYNPFRYCGEYFDEESELIYLRNRYYDPSIGAFITEDPARDGLNWYSYCSGNPVNFVDPLGLVDVELKYALQNIGVTEINWNGESKTTTFTYEGKQVSINVNRVINGRSIVDSYGLANIFKENGFNIDQEKFVPTEETRFDSADDAALAFSLKYYGQAVDEKQEYGASIAYIESEDAYIFENVTYSFDPKVATKGYIQDNKRVFINETCSVGRLKGRTVGLIHIHWDVNSQYENFSDSDHTQYMKNLALGKTYNYYLYNHNGFFIERFDWNEYYISGQRVNTAVEKH